MTPTETLKHEHQIILMVADAARRQAQSIQATGKVNAEKIAKLLEFFENFVDRCHHTKEEGHLFVKLHDHGLAWDEGPLLVMWAEHDQGRRHVAAIKGALDAAAAGQPPALAQVKDNLLAFVELYRQHIDKEDNVLYPMANRLLTQEDQQALAAAFDRVEAEELGEGTHEKYHRLAHELAEE